MYLFLLLFVCFCCNYYLFVFFFWFEFCLFVCLFIVVFPCFRGCIPASGLPVNGKFLYIPVITDYSSQVDL